MAAGRGVRWVAGWVGAVALIVAAPPDPTGGRGPAPTEYTFDVVRTYPHDPGAYTQGLVFHQGCLYESIGLHGRSAVRRVDLETGRVLAQRPLAAHLFGEGLTVWNDRLVQLTWQAGVGFVYNRHTFELVETFRYAGEGWGLTTMADRLVLSDGSAVLRLLDPHTWREVGRLPVHDRGRPVDQLNELEFIGGEIWANIWGVDHLARIDPGTGRVLGWVRLAGLRDLLGPGARGAEVLNGIAWDSVGGRLFVTGKNWPRLFEIRVSPRVGPLRQTTDPP